MPPKIPYRLPDKIADDWPLKFWSDVTVLLAVSGGADSMALLRAMNQLKRAGQGKLIAVHFNHQLRGQESDADEQATVEACQQIDIRLICGRGNVTQEANRKGDGLESAARDQRYQFFIQTAQQVGARYLATAHTADDQAETILHRILRGTGIRGLCGIPRLRQLNSALTLIRPMLEITREDILLYLQEIGQNYQEDHSNFDLKFTRNRIRKELLPQLAEQYNPNVRIALRQLGSLAKDAQQFTQQQIAQLIDSQAVTINEQQITLDCSQLQSYPRYLLRELMIQLWSQQQWPEQSMGYVQWNSLVEMIVQPEGSKPPNLSQKKISTFSGNIRVEKNDGMLYLISAKK